MEADNRGWRDRRWSSSALDTIPTQESRRSRRHTVPMVKGRKRTKTDGDCTSDQDNCFRRSGAIVVKHARRRRSFNARDCAQVLVDRPQLMVRHILVVRPRHDLQQVAVEGWR